MEWMMHIANTLIWITKILNFLFLLRWNRSFRSERSHFSIEQWGLNNDSIQFLHLKAANRTIEMYMLKERLNFPAFKYPWGSHCLNAIDMLVSYFFCSFFVAFQFWASFHNRNTYMIYGIHWHYVRPSILFVISFRHST